MSTSPSYPLLATMDEVRDLMQREGKERIDKEIELADKFRERAATIQGIKSVDGSYTGVDGEVASYDRTKVNLDVRGTGLTGDYIAERLESDYGIVTEKEETNSLCFLTTFQITKKDLDYTLNALERVVNEGPTNGQGKGTEVRIPAYLEKRYETYEAEEKKKKDVLLDDSRGYALAENVKCYPPGIDVGKKGEVINDELIDFLKAQRGRNHVVSTDKTLTYVRVVDEEVNK